MMYNINPKPTKSATTSINIAPFLGSAGIHGQLRLLHLRFRRNFRPSERSVFFAKLVHFLEKFRTSCVQTVVFHEQFVPLRFGNLENPRSQDASGLNVSSGLKRCNFAR